MSGADSSVVFVGVQLQYCPLSVTNSGSMESTRFLKIENDGLDRDHRIAYQHVLTIAYAGPCQLRSYI